MVFKILFLELYGRSYKPKIADLFRINELKLFSDLFLNHHSLRQFCFCTFINVTTNRDLVSLREKIQAWCVHIFTASGLLSAFMAIIAIDYKDWRACFLWLFLCFLIDSLDGTLARKFRVKEILPYMDGKNIDYIIDFATYAIIPAFFFYKAEMVATEHMYIALAIMLLSAALYYGKVGMVADDQYFIGFPVLWNFVVFFQFFICQNNQMLNLVSVIFFGILHFVPLKFAYPSMTKKYFWSHLIFSILGLIGALAVLYYYPIRNGVFELAAIGGAVYFSLFALFDTLSTSRKITL